MGRRRRREHLLTAPTGPGAVVETGCSLLEVDEEATCRVVRALVRNSRRSTRDLRVMRVGRRLAAAAESGSREMSRMDLESATDELAHPFLHATTSVDHTPHSHCKAPRKTTKQLHQAACSVPQGRSMNFRKTSKVTSVVGFQISSGHLGRSKIAKILALQCGLIRQK